MFLRYTSSSWVFAFAATAFFVTAASARTRSLEDTQATWAAIGDLTSVPYGWADLCGRQPQECKVSILAPVDLRLFDKTVRFLELVNAKVNSQIKPISNYKHWHTKLDHWDYPTDGKGDCKIYALWKRKLLIDIGFPRQALLMTIVRDHSGSGHVVLTVKTDHGDFVLDNMRSAILPWDKTGYRFVKRQSQYDPNLWVSFTGYPSPATESEKARLQETANAKTKSAPALSDKSLDLETTN